MTSLLLRADASPQMGTGHVLRCLALAEPWLQAGSQVTLLAAELPEALEQRAVSLGITVDRLNLAAGSPEDAQAILTAVATGPAGWVVLDGYRFGAGFQRTLKAAGLRVLAFDDYGQASYYFADFLLNQNLGASEELYPDREPHTRLLLGTRFVQLRSEFLKSISRREKALNCPVSNEISLLTSSATRVLITLGGSDPDNVTSRVISALSGLAGVDVTVVVGSSNPHFEQLEREARKGNCRLVRSASNMPELMSQADIAIAAGGTTAWELCYLGVPMIVLALADNQRANVEQLASAGVAVNLGWHADLTGEEFPNALIALIKNRETRQRMRQAALELVDGLGSLRVWFHLNADQLRLRPAGPEDCRRVWEWANEPAVRAVSFSSDPILWEDHKKWFAQRLADPDCRFWIAETADESTPLGQVRFDVNGSEATISVSLDAAHRGRHRGSLLIWTACRKLAEEQAVSKVIACIKPDNAASIRAFEKAGFQPAGETEIKAQSALRFEWQPGN